MRVKKLVLGFVIPIVILVLWYTATTFMNVPTTILPKIRNVIVTAVDMSKTGQLPVDLGISIGRVVKGIFGISNCRSCIGICDGNVRDCQKELLLPIITTIRQIPMIAWIPLIILWAGIGEASKVIIIVIAAVFPILVNTMSGITGTPKGYVEVPNFTSWEDGKRLQKYFAACVTTDACRGLSWDWGFLDGVVASRADCSNFWY